MTSIQKLIYENEDCLHTLMFHGCISIKVNRHFGLQPNLWTDAIGKHEIEGNLQVPTLGCF